MKRSTHWSFGKIHVDPFSLSCHMPGEKSPSHASSSAITLQSSGTSVGTSGTEDPPSEALLKYPNHRILSQSNEPYFKQLKF